MLELVPDSSSEGSQKRAEELDQGATQVSCSDSGSSSHWTELSRSLVASQRSKTKSTERNLKTRHVGPESDDAVQE